MEEVWKDIVGYENKYQISNLGNARSITKRGKIRNMKPCIWGRYYQIDLFSMVNGKRTHNTQYIHRLVALHFVPNPKNVSHVNHIDGNEHNNVYTNLEWVTNSENLIHASRVLGHHPFGKQPKKVNQYTLDDKLIASYNSIGEAVEGAKKEAPNANRSHISECCSGKTNIAYGYKWKFAE